MFDSLLNFRPIGGSLYKHCDGVEDPNLLNLCGYRCARPDKISEEDFGLIQSQLGIRYILDLRNYEVEYLDSTGMKVIDNSSAKAELRVVDVIAMERNSLNGMVWKQVNGSDEPPYRENSIFIHYMITLTAANYFKQYLKNKVVPLWRDIVDGSGLAIKSALEIIQNHGSDPFLICCHAGKDRTGILSALLLSICGYDKNYVADDYTMTTIGLPSTHDELKMYSPNFREAPREVMMRLLEHIDAGYGSVAEYLVSIGISLDQQEKIKQNLTGTETSG